MYGNPIEVTMLISIPTAVGEIADKVTILRIKMKKITVNEKLVNITNECLLLNSELMKLRESLTDAQNEKLSAIITQLEQINLDIWNVEDNIRACEDRKSFGHDFIQLARNVYKFNDKRAALKRQINNLVGPKIVEEKSYAKYATEHPV